MNAVCYIFNAIKKSSDKIGGLELGKIINHT